MIRAGVAGAALALAALPGVASAQTVEPEVTTYYFKCANAVKVQTVGQVLNPQNWSTDKPATSFTAGAGCGFLDGPAVAQGSAAQNLYDAHFSGIHGGAIEKIKIELHNLVTSRARQAETVNLHVRIFDANSTTAKPLAEKSFSPKPELSGTGASEKMIMEFTKLKIPAVDGRRLWINVHAVDEPQIWVFDASEIPAGVTFTAPLPTLPPA